MNFEVNQIFKGTYPPECAVWCNSNGCYIEELASENDVRVFQVKEIPQPTEEEIELRNLQSELSELQNTRDEMHKYYLDCLVLGEDTTNVQEEFKGVISRIRECEISISNLK